MRLYETIKYGVAILTIKCDLLDDDEGALLQEKIESLATDDIRKVILDLGRVNRITSRGLGILISAHNTLRGCGGDLRLARIGRQIHDILAVTRLVRVFNTYERVEGALASYGT